MRTKRIYHAQGSSSKIICVALELIGNWLAQHMSKPSSAFIHWSLEEDDTFFATECLLYFSLEKQMPLPLSSTFLKISSTGQKEKLAPDLRSG